MENLFAYAEKHTSCEPPNLAAINRDTHLNELNPQMLSGHLQGRFLSCISRLAKPQNILEIGTYTGYSALSLAEGLVEKGTLLTLEKNKEIAEKAIQNFKNSPFFDKITCHIGEALKIIPELTATFDIVFIDADKENYLNYYKMILPKVKKGGLILVDNVWWSGKVCDSSIQDKSTQTIRDLNQWVQQDEQVDNVFLPIRDGLMMIIKW